MEKDIDRRVTRLEEHSKVHDKSIAGLSNRVCFLEGERKDIAVLREKVDNIDFNVLNINQKMEKQAENKYGKYWQVLFYVFTTCVGLLVGYLLSLN